MRRPVSAALAAALCLPLTVLGASPAVARTTSRSVTLTRGVTLTHSTFAMRSGAHRYPESVWTLRVGLSRHVGLDAASPRNLIGSPRATALAIGRQERALAGINGDTFYFSDPTAVPRGGITHNGRILKSSLQNQNAVLYTTRNGTAAIGNPRYSGTVSTIDAHGHHRSFKIRTANSLENARNGGLSLVDATVQSAGLPKCGLARITPTTTRDRYRVSSLTLAARRYTRATGTARALVSCSPGTKTWMRQALRPGGYVSVHAGYAVAGITTLLSANRQLIRNGRRYTDPTGINVYGNQRKPETFGCVLPGARTVLLGVVEGGRAGRAGMTYAQLTTYLLARKCRSAVVFDGSGSSTLVAKRPGHGLAIQNRTTAPGRGHVRKVVNGLYVVRR